MRRKFTFYMVAPFIFLLLISFPIFATTYYVSNSGSNSNNGESIDSAFATLQYAADNVDAGDFLDALESSFYCASKIIDNIDDFIINKKATQKQVEKLAEILIYSGKAMQLAGSSKPASGFEHKIAHMMDQLLLEEKLKTPLHGLACGIGTLISFHYYETAKTHGPHERLGLKYTSDDIKNAF